MSSFRKRRRILEELRKGNSPMSSTGSSGIELLRRVFKNIGWFSVVIGLLLFILGLFAISWMWGILGIVFLGGGVVCLGAKIVPEPEIWILLRFGKRRKLLPPGFHLTIPLVDTIGKISAPYERVLPLILLPKDELPKFQLHTGVIYLRDYRVTLNLGSRFTDIVNAEYGESDWEEWLRNKLNSIVARYIQTLSVSDATERGMLGDNLLDRIAEAGETTEKRLPLLKEVADRIKKEMEQYGDRKVDISNPVLEELENEIERITSLPKLYEGIAKDLVKLINREAKDRGIIKITGVFTGALKLAKEQEAAIEKVRVEKLNAEAALYQALQESAGRIGPVLDMKKKLQDAGMDSEDGAMQTALMFELVDTICKHGGAWALGLAPSMQGGQGAMGAIPALLMKLLQSAITPDPKTDARGGLNSRKNK